MKLTLRIKIKPNEQQRILLIQTIKEANRACSYISNIAWESKVFAKYGLHGLCYDDVRKRFKLSSQMVVRCIGKVADAYKLDQNKRREFKLYGSISYDSRILSYRENEVSIWTINKRQKIPFVCHNEGFLGLQKGEADLVFRNGKFFLHQTIDVQEGEIEETNKTIGLDFGVVDMVCTSDGNTYSHDFLKKNYRKKRANIRSSIQSKGTRGCRKLLKRLNGREKTTATIINHTISKRIVGNAKENKACLAIENLKNIRKSGYNKSHRFRELVNTWSFNQLRKFISYKCKLAGVPLVVVNPSYTSQTCSICHHVGKRNGKSFRCPNCGNKVDADINAAINIAQLGDAINHPEKSEMYSCSLQHSI